MTNNMIFKVTIVATLIAVCFASEYVPLLLWSNAVHRPCGIKSLQPGEKISSVLSESYLECLAASQAEKIVVFNYDTLSVEDLRSFSNGKEQPFKAVHSYMKRDNSSLAVPSVEPSNLIEDLVEKLKEKFNHAEIEVIKLDPVERSKRSLLLKRFSELDQQIANKLESLKGNYLAVVTSENSLQNRAKQLGSGRTLLATGDAAEKRMYLVGKCVFMVFSSLELYVGTISTKLTMGNNTYDMEKCVPADWKNGTNTATKTFVSSSTAITRVSITFQYELKYYPYSSYYWWSLKEAVVDLTFSNTTTAKASLNMPETEIAAPQGWSFGCLEPGNLTAANSSSDIVLRFENLQVQPFDVKNSTFSESLDCVGWFTGPIWTGLLVGFLLVFILFFGLGMFSYVNTMDRFDNPKGKTITVPQVDNN